MESLTSICPRLLSICVLSAAMAVGCRPAGNTGSPNQTGKPVAGAESRQAALGRDSAGEELTAIQAAPDVAEIHISLAQVGVGRSANVQAPATSYLCFRLSIANKSEVSLPLRVDDIQLTFDGKKLESFASSSGKSLMIRMPLPREEAAGGTVPQFEQARLLESHDIPPHETVEGWLGFGITEEFRPRTILSWDSARPTMPITNERFWILSVPLGSQVWQLDVREASEPKVEFRVRPSALDDSVSVLEVKSSWLGFFGIERVLGVWTTLVKEDRGCVIQFTTPNMRNVVSGFASLWLEMATLSDPKHAPVIVWHTTNYLEQLNVGFLGVFGPFGVVGPRGLGRANQSEAGAVIEILGRRPDAVPRLLELASHSSPEVRLLATGALRSHVDQPGVVAALTQAAKDEESWIRWAAICSLNTLYEREDQHTADADRLVLTDEMLELMLEAVNDRSERIRTAALTSLTNASDTRATSMMREALKDSSPMVQTSAIEALWQAGAMTASEAVTEKLQRGVVPRIEESRAAVQERNGALIARFRELRAGSVEEKISRYALLRLAEMGDTAAFDELCALVATSDGTLWEEAQVLGALGDGRAIKALKAALTRRRGGDRDNVLRALVKLDAPDVLQQIREEIAEAVGPETASLVTILINELGNDALDTAGPLLDNSMTVGFAAGALWGLGTPEAMHEIRGRLMKPEYEHSQLVLQVLAERAVRVWQSAARQEVKQGERQRILTLLREVASSLNPGTRKAVAGYLRQLDTEPHEKT